MVVSKRVEAGVAPNENVWERDEEGTAFDARARRDVTPARSNEDALWGITQRAVEVENALAVDAWWIRERAERAINTILSNWELY